MEPGKAQLGEQLVKNNIITREQLNKALKVQKERTKKGEKVFLGNIIVELGFSNDEYIAKVLAWKHNVQYFNVDDAEITEEVINMVPHSTANRYKVFPLKLEKDKLIVAMMHPGDLNAIDDLNIVTGKEIQPVMIEDSQLEKLINKVSSKHAKEVEKYDYLSQPEIERPVAKDVRLRITSEPVSGANPSVELLNKLLNLAVKEKADDLHIEPQKDKLKIKFRIDGVLRSKFNIAFDYHETLVSRIKVLANMDITDNKTPQDGCFTMESNGKIIDIRVFSLPAYYGERVTLRLLSYDSSIPQLGNLGMTSEQLLKIKKITSYPHGFILVAGSTGSGKSTTLYSLLSDINKVNRTIISLEDPIERVIDGVSQVQYNNKAGISFSASLQSVLRNHPDVVMISEIKDAETGSMAAGAALTGHLLLSTINASDSSRGLLQLLDMGVQPYMVESTLTCVLSQKLLRQLCNKCKAKRTITKEELLKHIPRFPLKDQEEVLDLYEASGCSSCDHTGYTGRTGVFELLVVSDKVRKAIKEVQASTTIRKIAIAEGMVPFYYSALLKVKDGTTSLQEFRRVVG